MAVVAHRVDIEGIGTCCGSPKLRFEIGFLSNLPICRCGWEDRIGYSQDLRVDVGVSEGWGYRHVVINDGGITRPQYGNRFLLHTQGRS